MGVGRYIIVMGRWVYIFGHRPTGDVPGIPDGQSAPERGAPAVCVDVWNSVCAAVDCGVQTFWKRIAYHYGVCG